MDVEMLSCCFQKVTRPLNDARKVGGIVLLRSFENFTGD